MKNKFAIGIPTLNRFDLLHPALLFYVRDFPETEIFVIDNGRQDIASKIIGYPNLHIMESETNLGVARSWNRLCERIYATYDNALILNDDIYFGRKDWEVDNLLENFRSDMYLSVQQWCVFILPKRTYEIVGEFDEAFYPAYYEDNDFQYRMKLKGLSDFKIPFLNPFVYSQSQTIEKMPSLRDNVLKNKEYYISKWGGEPNKETFTTPFNK